MRVFLTVRRSWSSLPPTKKRRLLLMAVPAGCLGLILASPFLLFAMMIGSRLLPLVAGPVNIWNATSHTPPAADLAGYYRLSSETARIPIDLAPSTRLRSGFRLGADHSLEVTGLPDFDGLGKPTNCSYDGTGTWSTWDGGDGVRLTLNLDVSTPPRRGEPPRCAPVSLGLFHVLGHRPAYRFWYNVGDPDNAMGLLYVREGR